MSSRTPQMPLAVQKIACVNHAAFVMRFSVESIRPDGTLATTGQTGNFAVGRTGIIDMAQHGGREGALIRPRVRAVAGTTNSGNVYVQYARNGQTATYEVRGTTLNFRVTRIG
jgi:hypothetical protein